MYIYPSCRFSPFRLSRLFSRVIQVIDTNSEEVIEPVDFRYRGRARRATCFGCSSSCYFAAWIIIITYKCICHIQYKNKIIDNESKWCWSCLYYYIIMFICFFFVENINVWNIITSTMLNTCIIYLGPWHW